MEIQFDNHDERIKFYELMLERNLKNLPEIVSNGLILKGLQRN